MYNLKLNFVLERHVLQKNMEQVVVSFFKAAIKNESEELYEKLFSKGEASTKKYCFSLYLPGAKFEEDGIALSKNYFNVIFSDADQEELIMFYNAFIGMKFRKYPLKNNYMELTHVSTLNLKEIQEDEIVIKMLSPIMVREHDKDTNKDKYLTFNDDKFSDVLKSNLEYQLKMLNLDLGTKDFSIEPVKCKKVVIPTFGELQDASIGIFKITGDPRLLNFIYMAGVGSRRSEGRGKFEIIS